MFAYSHAGVLGRTVVVRPHNIYGPQMGWDHVIPQFALRLFALARRGDGVPDPGDRPGDPVVLLHRRLRQTG